MFKDYYQILGVSFSATKEEIKKAYRKKSLEWHPDRNPGVDVTEMMQDINESYKILNDNISRARYNKEYQLFTKQCENSKFKRQRPRPQSESWNYDYDVYDEDLRDDINKARVYAKDRVDEFFKSLTYIIHSGFISGYQNRYGDNLKPPTNVYHRMTA